jgi:hypothetical protein
MSAHMKSALLMFAVRSLNQVPIMYVGRRAARLIGRAANAFRATNYSMRSPIGLSAPGADVEAKALVSTAAGRGTTASLS